jgi:hypothetical protein
VANWKKPAFFGVKKRRQGEEEIPSNAGLALFDRSLLNLWFVFNTRASRHAACLLEEVSHL